MAKDTSILEDIAQMAVTQFQQNENAVIENFIIDQARNKTSNLGITELQDPAQLKAKVATEIQDMLSQVIGNNPLLRPHAELFTGLAVDKAVQSRLEFFTQKPERTVQTLLSSVNQDISNHLLRGEIDYQTALSRTLSSINDPRVKKYLNEEQTAKVRERMVEELAYVGLRATPDPQNRAAILDAVQEYLPAKKILRLIDETTTRSKSENSALSDQEMQVAYRKVIAGKPLTQKEQQGITAQYAQEIVQAVKSQTPEQLDEAAGRKREELLRTVGSTAQNDIYDFLNNPEEPLEKRRQVYTTSQELGVLQSRSSWLGGRMNVDSAQTAVEQGFTAQVDINFLDAASMNRGIVALYRNFQWTKQYGGDSTFLDQENLNLLRKTYNEGNLSARTTIITQLHSTPSDARQALISQLAYSDPTLAATLELKSLNPNIDPAKLFMYENVSGTMRREQSFIGKILDSEQLRIRGSYIDSPEIGNVLLNAYADGPKDLRSAVKDTITPNRDPFMGAPITIRGKIKKPMGLALNTLNMEELKETLERPTDLYFGNAPLREERIPYLVPENLGGGAYYLSSAGYGQVGMYVKDKEGNRVIMYREKLQEMAIQAAKRRKEIK